MVNTVLKVPYGQKIKNIYDSNNPRTPIAKSSQVEVWGNKKAKNFARHIIKNLSKSPEITKLQKTQSTQRYLNSR